MSDESNSINKKTLLEKYEIPVEFLDFEYVNNCEDAKTLEKIVKILRSGEEGFYPQLTQAAEEKLKKLKPYSKMFRTETPAMRKECLNEDERVKLEEEMNSWLEEMKKVDSKVKEILPKVQPEIPIRKARNVEEASGADLRPAEKINSMDYSKWDKFDVDAAVMKIDLEEERQRELVAMKNKKNNEKTTLIEEIADDEVDCLSEFEKDYLSSKFKEKGNECFKVKEYDEAIKEYTQSLRIKKTAASFNNRALIYLKQKKFIKALADTNECLKIEPMNVKAMLRKAQALTGENMLAEAFDVYEKILEIDHENQIALAEIAKLRVKVPPRNAFRMKIEDVSDVTEIESVEEKPKPVVKKSQKTEKLEVSNASAVLPKMVQNIVIDEPSLFDKLKPKSDKNQRESLVMPGQQPENKSAANKILIQEIS